MNAALRFSLAALAWACLASSAPAAEEVPDVPVASYANKPEVKKDGERAAALLAEQGIRGHSAGSAGMTLSVPAQRAEEALKILGAAKQKEGLRLTLLRDVSKSAKWPEGPALKPELSLAAKLDGQGKPVIAGELRIANPRPEFLTMGAADNRWALAFLVMNELGNPVAPVMRGKSDPAYQTIHLDSQAVHVHPLENLDFITGSAWAGYDLKAGENYRVIAVYRPAGRDGPGFCSDEVILKIPQ